MDGTGRRPSPSPNPQSALDHPVTISVSPPITDGSLGAQLPISRGETTPPTLWRRPARPAPTGVSPRIDDG